MTSQNDPSTTVSCPVLHLRPSGVGLVPSWKVWRSKEQQATLDPWSLQTSGCYGLLLRAWCHAAAQTHSWRWWRWHPKEVQFPRMKMFFENYGHNTKKFRYIVYHARHQNQTNVRFELPAKQCGQLSVNFPQCSTFLSTATYKVLCVTNNFLQPSNSKMFEKESGCNKPLYNEDLGITNNFLYPRNSKMYEKEPRYSEQILPVPWPFVKSRF